jgi:hypothetical protein
LRFQIADFTSKPQFYFFFWKLPVDGEISGSIGDVAGVVSRVSPASDRASARNHPEPSRWGLGGRPPPHAQRPRYVTPHPVRWHAVHSENPTVCCFFSLFSRKIIVFFAFWLFSSGFSPFFSLFSTFFEIGFFG